MPEVQLFLELPFRWKDLTGHFHEINSTKDLAKAIQSSMTTPHASHSFYKKELVLYIPTSGLFCSRIVTPDCKDLSKIFDKAPTPLTKTTAAALASVLVSGAANAIADRVKAGADASKTVHEVIDLSTPPSEVQKRYYKRLDRNQVVLKRDLSRYRNSLTTDSYGSINEWNFFEFPPIEQSFVISRDGTLWRYLNHQEKTHKTAFNDHFIPLTAFTPKAWFKFCLHLEYNAWHGPSLTEFFDRFDQGARVTRVTMPTAQYLATRKILENIKN
jgi:hypothetical protein